MSNELRNFIGAFASELAVLLFLEWLREKGFTLHSLTLNAGTILAGVLALWAFGVLH